MRIGIFDSGLGGINVLSCLLEKYPNNEYIFCGDTKNIPYGDKTKEELLNLSSNIIDFLLTKKVDIIIIACGTVSSTCYEDLKNKYQIPIYDIVSPTIDYLNKLDLKNIGVIGTKRTIESNIFKLKEKNMLLKSTPLFVPIIENNKINENRKNIINELSDFKKCDALVLGCTHYPLLKNIIEGELKIPTIDMGKCLTEKIELSNNSNQLVELYFSKLNNNIISMVKNIIKVKYKIIKK